MKYEDYLQSPSWKRRSGYVKQRDVKCVVCKMPVLLECHHIDYRGKPNREPFGDLVTLCKWCHAYIGGHHPIRPGEKLSKNEQRYLFASLMTKEEKVLMSVYPFMDVLDLDMWYEQ